MYDNRVRKDSFESAVDNIEQLKAIEYFHNLYKSEIKLFKVYLMNLKI